MQQAHCTLLHVVGIKNGSRLSFSAGKSAVHILDHDYKFWSANTGDNTDDTDYKNVPPEQMASAGAGIRSRRKRKRESRSM
jgi:hypothetical protein